MALIGSIAINMTTDTRAFRAGLARASAALQGFNKIGKTLFNSNPFFTLMAGGITAAKGIKQMQGFGKALSDASTEARVLFNAGLFGIEGGLHVFRNLVEDTAPALLRFSAGLGAMGIGLARIALAPVIKGLRLFGAALAGTIAVTRQAVNRLGELAAVAGGLAAYAIYRLTMAAGGLGEQTDRSRVVFGKFSGVVIDESNRMAEAFGVSRSAFLASASAFGSIFKAAGFDQKQAALLSTHFVKLAADLSSLAHIPVDQALEKIQSGLAGQVRPLREVGVFMSEEAIKSYAAAHGIGALNRELTESEKIQARVGFITEALKDAQGNLAQTADSAMNASRGLAGRLENLAQTIGTALLPVVGSSLSELQTGVQALSMAWQDWTRGAVSSQVGVVGAVGEAAASMGWFQKSIGFVADAWQTMKLGFYAAQSFISSGLSNIVKGLGTLAKAIDFALEKLTGKKSGLSDFMRTFSEDLDRLSQEQWKKFQTELAKPPASDGVNAWFAKAQERIKAMREEAAKAGVDVSKITPASTPGQAAKPAEGMAKFASAAVAGTREATNAILRGVYGGPATKGPADQTAKNTAATAEGVKKVAELMLRVVNGGGANAASPVSPAWADVFGRF